MGQRHSGSGSGTAGAAAAIARHGLPAAPALRRPLMLAMTPSSEPEMATAGLMIAFFPAHFFALPLRCCLSECSRDRLFSADFLRCLLDVAFPGAREISLFFSADFSRCLFDVAYPSARGVAFSRCLLSARGRAVPKTVRTTTMTMTTTKATAKGR